MYILPKDSPNPNSSISRRVLLFSQIDLEKIDKNYEAMCPKDVLAAATVYIKSYAKLLTLLEHVDDSKTAIASE